VLPVELPVVVRRCLLVGRAVLLVAALPVPEVLLLADVSVARRVVVRRREPEGAVRVRVVVLAGCRRG
jgi:hypothetical protein